MSEFLSLFTPMRRRNLLLVLIAALVVLLVLTIIGTPAPKIDTTFGGATVDLRADRAWVFLPRQCATVTWDTVGIQSFSVNGHIMAGRDEMEFCPTLNHTSLNFDITTLDGDLRTINLNIQDLPAAVITCMALLILLLPFLIATFYLVTLLLEEPPPMNMSSVLLLLALLLLFLLIQTVRTFSIESVLSASGISSQAPRGKCLDWFWLVWSLSRWQFKRRGKACKGGRRRISLSFPHS